MKYPVVAILPWVFGMMLTSRIMAFSVDSIFRQTREKLTSLFAPAVHTEIIERNIACSTHKKLVIDNPHGSIKIKADWEQAAISLRAVKKATAANLAKIHVDVDATDPDVVRMKTVFRDTAVKGSVDYALIVPKRMAVRLKNGNGAVKVKRFDGQVWAHTERGSIEISCVTDAIEASIGESGSITIADSSGSIMASTNRGDVHIGGARNSVVAHAPRGSVIVEALNVPPTSSLCLSAAGSLELILPTTTDAYVKAKTDHGRIISERPITLASKTITLDGESWQRFERNIEGTIGKGLAEISLASTHGTVKIRSSATA